MSVGPMDISNPALNYSWRISRFEKRFSLGYIALCDKTTVYVHSSHGLVSDNGIRPI